MAASKGDKNQVAGANESKSGYWLYEDGQSYWGINIYRFGKIGIEVTEEIHKKSVPEKVQYYIDNPPKPKVVVEEEHHKEKK